jgi:hypothetical protein
MTDIVETSTWETAIRQWETTDLALGGLGGVMNTPLIQFANRTKWLYDQIQSLTELPVAALPYPTIATSDNKLTVTPAASTAGGTVSIAAGTRLTLAEEVVSTATGRLRTFTTTAYTSADLLASNTYYLRSQVDGNGDLAIYVQRGTDSDSIPATLLGTPDAASCGGFDSTVLDILIAKVETGSAGTVPTVTELANAARLFNSQLCELTNIQNDSTQFSFGTYTATLNWARVPAMHTLTWYNVLYVVSATDYDLIMSLAGPSIDRYRITGQAQQDYMSALGPAAVQVTANA